MFAITPGALSVPYVDLSARFALRQGLDVVVEGILHAEICGEMLARRRASQAAVIARMNGICRGLAAVCLPRAEIPSRGAPRKTS